MRSDLPGRLAARRLLLQRFAVGKELKLREAEEVLDELLLPWHVGEAPDAGHLLVEAEPPGHGPAVVMGEGVEGAVAGGMGDLGFVHDDVRGGAADPRAPLPRPRAPP